MAKSVPSTRCAKLRLRRSTTSDNEWEIQGRRRHPTSGSDVSLAGGSGYFTTSDVELEGTACPRHHIITEPPMSPDLTRNETIYPIPEDLKTAISDNEENTKAGQVENESTKPESLASLEAWRLMDGTDQGEDADEESDAVNDSTENHTAHFANVQERYHPVKSEHLVYLTPEEGGFESDERGEGELIVIDDDDHLSVHESEGSIFEVDGRSEITYRSGEYCDF